METIETSLGSKTPLGSIETIETSLGSETPLGSVETIETSLGSAVAVSRSPLECPPTTPSPPPSAIAAEGTDGGGGDEGGTCVQVLMDFVPRLVHFFWVLSLSCALSLSHSRSPALAISALPLSRARDLSLARSVFRL